MERWLPVVGFEGIYEVSDRGRVRSMDRVIPHPRCGLMQLRGCILMPVPSHGYLCVSLSKDGRRRTRRVHHLVLEAFVGPRPEGTEGRHFPDRDTSNNRLGNLSWSTHVENIGDKALHGTAPRGARHANARLVDADIPVIRARLAAGESQVAIGADYGVSNKAISLIARGKRWTHVPSRLASAA